MRVDEERTERKKRITRKRRKKEKEIRGLGEIMRSKGRNRRMSIEQS